MHSFKTELLMAVKKEILRTIIKKRKGREKYKNGKKKKWLLFSETVIYFNIVLK